MKKILLYLLFAVLATVSCTKDNDFESSLDCSEEEIDGFLQEIFWEQTDDVYYEVISEQILSPEEIVEDIYGSVDNLDAESLEIKEAFLKRCEEKRKELNEEDPDEAAAFCFARTCFKYRTVDQNGDEIELSAFMGWAVHGFDYWPYDQNHILFCCPYTHTKEDECATESKGGNEFTAMWHDNLFIMPDGQGFGEDKNNVQTYLNHELHAQQYYDALLAGKKLYLDKYGKLEKDWTLRVVGASQGAGDAIALHKYLDTHFKRLDLTQHYNNGNRKKANELCKQYGYPEGTPIIESPLRYDHKFEFSYVCCGPYSPEVTMQTYSEWKQMSYPCVIPLVIKSMLACYADFLCGQKNYVEADFFSEDWNENSAEFDKIYLEKTMDSDNLNRHICWKLNINMKDDIPMAPLRKILSEDMCNPESQIYKDLMTCLKKQDLTRKWTPRTKTKLFFTVNDEVVPYANTQNLIKLFEDNKCTVKEREYSWTVPEDKYDPKGHVDCCTRYMISGWEW